MKVGYLLPPNRGAEGFYPPAPTAGWRQRQRLLAAFAAEAALLDREEIAAVAEDFADAEEQALAQAEQFS